MILYLSGPITNNPHYGRDFMAAATELRAAGYDVINPAELDRVIGGALDYDKIMSVDLVLLAQSDVLVQLPGWEASRGCNIEYGFATAKHMRVAEFEEVLKW